MSSLADTPSQPSKVDVDRDPQNTTHRDVIDSAAPNGDGVISKAESEDPVVLSDAGSEGGLEEESNLDDGKSSSADSTATGRELDTKQLYRRDRYESWSEWSPDDINQEVDDAEHKKFALIVRRERDPEGSGMILHSVTVQSPQIRAFLSKVFRNYRGVYTKLKDLTFRPPFHEFFYRWDTLQKLFQKVKDDLARQHIRLLLDVIGPKIQVHLDVQKDLLANGLITFDYLWAIFEPDIEVYFDDGRAQGLYTSVCCFYRRSQETTFFVLECKFIDYNGSSLGYALDQLNVEEFNGHKLINELNPIPSALVQGIESVRISLTERGRAFERLMGMHYRQYSGIYMQRGRRFGSRKCHIDKGRIMVDARLYYEQDPDTRKNLARLGGDAASDDDNDVQSDTYSDTESESSMIAGVGGSQRNLLREDEYRLCSPFVRGYCLTSKTWATFHVEQVADIEWDDEAFERLVLPHDHKELILAFAESQLSHKDGFDDIISGKGQGIIMLLSGEPGVGKTLTAESVAEEMKRPLYAMSAGELGDEAHVVESGLQKVLEISTKWDAILLIDECDIFLEQRTTSDIVRNKLVAVFLRLLEYYKGVLFLTTNRVTTFDAAFKSRIHLTIDYSPLDFQSRRLVWNTFAGPVSASAKYSSGLSEAELDMLAELNLNGREIKNIVKTARLLANRKGISLTMENVKTVLRIKKVDFPAKVPE
ncbi:MAG: hypothetical protein M1822_008506 [Bathelium mastoideum]|nr:MAG: hypothetical protein M1822_008506 [Bathelium mastoideum]